MKSNSEDRSSVLRAVEAAIIERKQGQARGEAALRSSVKWKLWSRTPEWVRRSRFVRLLKQRYMRDPSCGGGYLGVCLRSHLNYVLNRPRVFPAGQADYEAAAQLISDELIARALGMVRGLAVDVWEKEVSKSVTRRGRFWEYEGVRLPRNCFTPEVFLHRHGLPLLPDEALRRIEKACVFDVGASIGDSAAILSKYTEQTVYSFESDENTFALLKESVKENGLYRVNPVQMAIGLGSPVVLDSLPRDTYFHHKCDELNAHFEAVGVSLDSFAMESGILNVGLIKLDIEGFELDAIRGAAEVIKRFKPVIIASLYHTGKDYFEIPVLLQALNSEYRFKIVKLNEACVTMEVTLLAY